MIVSDSPAGAARSLRSWLRANHCPMPDRSALEEFIRQLQAVDSDGAPRLRNGSYTLARYAEGVYLLPPLVAPAPLEPLPIAPGETLDVAGVGRIALQCLSAGKVAEEPLQIRWRAGGERLHLPGREGSTSLKNFLQEARVPPWWRDRLPLLYRGEELLAVGDLTQSETRGLQRDGAIEEPRWRLIWQRESAHSD